MQLTVTSDDDMVFSVDVRASLHHVLYLPALLHCHCDLTSCTTMGNPPQPPHTHRVWPRIVARLSVQSAASLQVEASEIVSTVKAILEAETGISASQQRLLFNGALLKDRSALLCNELGRDN